MMVMATNRELNQNIIDVDGERFEVRDIRQGWRLIATPQGEVVGRLGLYYDQYVDASGDFNIAAGAGGPEGVVRMHLQAVKRTQIRLLAETAVNTLVSRALTPLEALDAIDNAALAVDWLNTDEVVQETLKHARPLARNLLISETYEPEIMGTGRRANTVASVERLLLAALL